MSNHISSEQTFSDGNCHIRAAFQGSPDEVAAFAAKFSAFIKSITPEDPSNHWSGLSVKERQLAPINKIGAIKEHRERTRLGLRESKDCIDAYLAGVANGKVT